MKLLVLTQAVDLDNPVLGFFHGWLEALAKHFDTLEVVCLYEGRHALPANVRVHSLGKENGESRMKYLSRFYQYVWRLRHEYQAVFVHMNQEYVMLAGVFWRLAGKRVYLWNNFHRGGVGIALASRICDTLFCTSRAAYAARYPNIVLMPVGIDTEVFIPGPSRPPAGSILSLGRIAPEKQLDVLIDALGRLEERGVDFSLDLYGDALPKDETYRDALVARMHDLGLDTHVTLHPGVPNRQTPGVYSAHEFFVNLSPSGMYDKTIFEAGASGCIALASSADFTRGADARCVFPERDAKALADRLEALVSLPEVEKSRLRNEQRKRVVAEHGLSVLAERLAEAIH